MPCGSMCEISTSRNNGLISRAKETWGITFSSRQETQNAKFVNKTSRQIVFAWVRVAFRAPMLFGTAIARLKAIRLVKRPQLFGQEIHRPRFHVWIHGRQSDPRCVDSLE